MPIVNGHWKPTHVTDPFNPQEAMYVGVTSFVAFLLAGIYLTRTLNPKKNNDEYGARILSLVHAVGSVFGTGYAMYEHDGGWFDSPTTRLEADWQAFSVGYFVSDTIIMILYKWDTMFGLHHAVTLSCCGSTLVPSCRWAYGVCFVTVGGEFSNISMHIRWLLHADGYRHTSMFAWMTRLWFASFFVLRFFGAPFGVYHMVMNMPIVFAPMAIAIMVVGWKFFVDTVMAERRGEHWFG